MKPQIVEGDILDQPVEVIINPWNRNIIPWWILIPQGVSGAIKKRAGSKPFKALAKCGPIPLGRAVETHAGKLKFKSIIHVAGINLLWFATRFSIQESVRNAMKIVNSKYYNSVAFPIIGSGSGNRGRDKALSNMLEAFKVIESNSDVRIVKYVKNR